MQKIKKISEWVLNKGVLAWTATLLVWFYIITTLRNGISCDEGYYLMGFLREQNTEGMPTDFHAIISALCHFFPDDDIMVFRYLRLIFNILSLIIFARTSFVWLSKKKNLQISPWAYYPMIALTGAMSFTFATPTISYDSLELIIALLTASLLFILISYDNFLIKHVSAFCIGFLLWFACSNYPTAGVCLAALFTLIFWIEESEKKWRLLLIGALGGGTAIIVSHFFIHDMRIWFINMSEIFISTFTEESKSRHDAGNIVSSMLVSISKVVAILLPTTAIFTLYFKKVKIAEKIQWIIIIAACFFLLVTRDVYKLRGTLLLIPIAILFAKLLAQPSISIKNFLSSKNFFLVLALATIPLAGVFGTNQAIMTKAIIFAPFWMLVFFFLSAQFEPKECNRLYLLYITILFAGYFYLGNFQRYHYYYTPRSSRSELVDVLRPQKVLVSSYQQQYYKDLLDILHAANCKKGDFYMAFGENQIAVYLAGGYIPGRLPYHYWQYKQFDENAPNAFILFKNEEDDVIEHFQNSNWAFPENYERIEMRPMSENMGEELSTVVYVKKNNIKE